MRAGTYTKITIDGNGNITDAGYVQPLDLLGTTITFPTGGLIPFAGGGAPSGWLLCDGSAISRINYATLFATIGTTYGVGDGSTTFNLPDLRGRVAVGQDNMGGTAAGRITSGNSGVAGTTLGASGGNENLHQHSHANTLSDPGHNHTIATGAPQSATVSGSTVSLWRRGSTTSELSGYAFTGITITNVNTGSGTSQNVQPTIILNYIIKY